MNLMPVMTADEARQKTQSVIDNWVPKDEEAELIMLNNVIEETKRSIDAAIARGSTWATAMVPTSAVSVCLGVKRIFGSTGYEIGETIGSGITYFHISW
jgi:hypothetical protein